MSAKKDIEAIVPESLQTVFWNTVATTDITRQLLAYETTIIVSTAAAAGTLYLPNVAEAKGLTYTIIQKVAGNNLVVKDGSNYAAISQNWSDITLNFANEFVVLRSDGCKWATVDSALSLS